MSFRTIAIIIGVIVLLVVGYGGWTELSIWWKTRDLKAVEAATQQFKQELDAAKGQRDADLAEVRKRDEQVQSLTRQIKAVIAAADRDRQARVRLEQQAAAREPEITRLREMVTKLEVERRQLAPVSNLREGIVELRKRGY